MFTHDAAPPTEGFTLLPDGTYDLQITNTAQKVSKKNDPMVNIECEVINNEEFNGKKIFYNVTFIAKGKPGDGMSTHFLKTIGQPWEGTITVDPENWVGERFRAKIGVREYKSDKTGKQVKTNDITSVDELEEFKNADVQAAALKDDAPF